ncbi:MAG: hypothetical protein ACRDJC_20055 [Thermomicrobiales bacterium]
MNEFVVDRSPPPLTNRDTAALFMWRGGGIVLIGELDQGRWVLARAWLQGDRLEHVRRWSFAAPIPFSGQVRRLISEAIGDYAHARDEAFRALAWAEALA